MRDRLRRAVVVGLVAATLTGCSASASPSTTGATAAPSARSSPSASAAPSQAIVIGPAVRLTLDTSGPMVASDAGPAGRHWVMPGAAARDRDGGFVLFIVWFGDEAGDQVVSLARSDEGREWRIGKDPIFTDLGMDVDHPGPIPTAALQLEDGTWVLYGWAAQRANPNLFTSWRAHAAEPAGPWTLDDATVLAPGPGGAWDSQMAVVGSVQPAGDGYALWYEAQGMGNTLRGDIGFATSADGLAWQKDTQPAIPRGHCGPPTAAALQQPQVEAWSGGFVGAFGSFAKGDDGMAVFGMTSTDGRAWACGAGQPILRAADIPDSTGIHSLASVPLDGDRFQLIVESLRDGRSELWSAIVEVGTQAGG